MSETAERLTVFISDARRGIDRATSEKLLSHGYTVGASDTSGNRRWTTDCQNAVVDTLDIINPQQWKNALKQFVDGARCLDMLINSAGILYNTPFEERSYGQDNTLTDVNVKGVHSGCYIAFSYPKGSRGQIINPCSASAIYGIPDMATYSVIELTVRGTTEALEVEWESHGTDVKVVWPFYVNTPMLKGVSTDGTKRMDTRITPDGVANVIVGCVDHKQGKITKAHFLVGLQTKLLYYVTSADIPFLSRFINTKLTTKRGIGL